jgi:hypothetical protein
VIAKSLSFKFAANVFIENWQQEKDKCELKMWLSTSCKLETTG